jgi:pyrroline-5-carboxylate reductase
MDKIGFIGTGCMGGTLLNSFLEFGAFPPERVLVSTRSLNKISDIKNRYPALKIKESNAGLAEECRTIFIGVKTGDVREVLLEIRAHLQKDSHIITMNGALMIKTIAQAFKGKLSRIIPSLTCETGESVTLVCHNSLVEAQEAARLEGWLSGLGLVKIIGEDHFEIGADMTSCAPAFWSSIVKHFVRAGMKHSRFNAREAEEMVLTTLLGTARLLQEKKTALDELMERVATRGGISEEGLKVLDEHLPFVFDELLEATLNKHHKVKSDMEKLFAGQRRD